MKIRVRWYGDTSGVIDSPCLEFKIKDGLLGSKLRYQLPSLNAFDDMEQWQLSTVCAKTEMPSCLMEEVASVGMKAFVRYRRRYYESADHRFMLTVDSTLELGRISALRSFRNARTAKQRMFVLELKYGEPADCLAGNVAGQFGLTMCKYSKYISAVDLSAGYESNSL